jgi:hypothetical protein
MPTSTAITTTDANGKQPAAAKKKYQGGKGSQATQAHAGKLDFNEVISY